jgi:hypothetical protein
MSEVVIVEKLFSDDELIRINEIQRSFPVYFPPARPTPPGFSVELPPGPPRNQTLRFAPHLSSREDVARYWRKLVKPSLVNGGLGGQPPSLDYLRALYAAQGQPLTDGIEEILDCDRLVELAHEVFDSDTVLPESVFANVYLPGQELLTHTDIPAFRGAERGQVPAWLLVAMHHSGLFERWRVHVATVVVYPDVSEGGAFYYFGRSPSEHDVTRVTVEPHANSAVVLDADTIFHGVERVGGESSSNDFPPDAYLVPESHADWRVCQGNRACESLAILGKNEVRFSLSWKAYCFPHMSAYRVWLEHEDDLDLSEIIPALSRLLKKRKSLLGQEMSEDELGAVIIDELIPFPNSSSG